MYGFFANALRIICGVSDWAPACLERSEVGGLFSDQPMFNDSHRMQAVLSPAIPLWIKVQAYPVPSHEYNLFLLTLSFICDVHRFYNDLSAALAPNAGRLCGMLRGLSTLRGQIHAVSG